MDSWVVLSLTAVVASEVDIDSMTVVEPELVVLSIGAEVEVSVVCIDAVVGELSVVSIDAVVDEPSVVCIDGVVDEPSVVSTDAVVSEPSVVSIDGVVCSLMASNDNYQGNSRIVTL